MKPTSMIKAFLQIGLLLFLCGIFIICYFSILHIINFPFRATNDMLHKNESVVVLDFLIPGGTYVEEKTTIGDVIRIKYKADSSFYEKAFKQVTELIPDRFYYIADSALFLLWSFLYMTFLRVFTFIGYSRAARISLLLGGSTYYFMPDFSLGRIDDFFFLGVPVLIIIIRYCIGSREKTKKSR